jgi:YgiT-type zinc finger domain-containing protein
MGDAVSERRGEMKCSIQGCPGEYDHRLIVHTVKHGAELLVFENVPAEVCDVCSDALLAPETIRHLEELMHRRAEPHKHAPVYSYT